MLVRLVRNEQGVTAIEFAVLGPVLLTMMIGIIELAMLFFVQHTIENATFNVSRMGKTGYVALESTREETIRQYLEQRTFGLLDADDIAIESKAYSGYAKVGQAEPYTDANANGQHDAGENYTDVNGNSQYDEDQGAVGQGEASEVVLYTITYPWQMITPIMNEFIGDNGAYVISATVVVKNEPYNDGN